LYKGERYYIAILNAETKEVEEIMTYEDHYANDFDHYVSFSAEAVERVEHNKSMIIWCNHGGTIEGEFRGEEIIIPNDSIPEITLV